MITATDILQARILIVDDQAAEIALLEQLLAGAGYAAVASTRDSREVCARHRERRFDLILLDLHMPGLDGFQVIEGLKAIEPDAGLPVLVVTARPDYKLRALKAGVRDFVSKPFEVAEVLIRVHNLVEIQLLQRESTIHNSARLENSQRIAHLGDWAFDPVHGRLVWSDEIYRILGLARQDTPPSAEAFYRRVHPDDLARVHREKAATAPGSHRVEFDHRIIRPDGEVRFIHQVTEISRDDQGRVIGESGTLQDVTDRVRADEALRYTETLYNGLTGSIPDHIYFKDRASRFLRVNGLMARDSGLPDAAAAVGKTDFDLFTEEHARQAFADEQRLMETGQPMVGVEEKETWLDGRTTWVSTTKAPLRDAEGRISGLVGISRDITERKRLEEQLRRAQRLESVGTLASGLAHDLNNILAPMLMAAGLLKDQLSSPEDRAILALVESGAQRGASIIRQLLTFGSSTEHSRVRLQLRHLLLEMEHLMRETFPRNIRIAQNIRGELWTVLADATQMHQVLMNLCVNARDAMPDGGSLQLSAENVQLDEHMTHLHAGAKPGPYVVLGVTDTGTGIPPENLQRIFDPFFTTKAVGKGTGLGLSTVIGILKGHDGFITVYSEPGQGTAFKVYLPALDGDALTAHVASRPPLAVGNKELILVVDDEPAILRATCGVLAKYDYRTLTAGNGEEAIKLFIQHGDAVRLVLTDMMMPGIGGLELMRSLRIIKPDITFIATSGLGPAENSGAF